MSTEEIIAEIIALLIINKDSILMHEVTERCNCNKDGVTTKKIFRNPESFKIYNLLKQIK